MYNTGLTGTEFITEVKVNLGNRSDKTDDEILRWLNLANVRIARVRNWTEMFNTTSAFITPKTSSDVDYETTYKQVNQKPGSIAAEAIDYRTGPDHAPYSNFYSGLKDMESVRMSFGATDLSASTGPFDRSYMLSYMGRRQFNRLIPNPLSSLAFEGYPTVFTQEFDQIYLYRIPNRPYSIDIGYWGWPSEIHDNALAVNVVLKGKDDLLVSMATSIGFNALGMQQQGGQYYAIAAALLQDAIREDDTNPSHVITGRGTSSQGGGITGQPWSDPFVQSIGT